MSFFRFGQTITCVGSSEKMLGSRGRGGLRGIRGSRPTWNEMWFSDLIIVI